MANGAYIRPFATVLYAGLAILAASRWTAGGRRDHQSKHDQEYDEQVGSNHLMNSICNRNDITKQNGLYTSSK